MCDLRGMAQGVYIAHLCAQIWQCMWCGWLWEHCLMLLYAAAGSVSQCCNLIGDLMCHHVPVTHPHAPPMSRKMEDTGRGDVGMACLRLSIPPWVCHSRYVSYCLKTLLTNMTLHCAKCWWRVFKDTCHDSRTYAGFEFFNLCTTYTSLLHFHSPMSCALASGDLHDCLMRHPSCQELWQNWWGDVALGLTPVGLLTISLTDVYCIDYKGLTCQTADCTTVQLDLT